MADLRASLEAAPVVSTAPCRLDMGGTLDLSTFYLPLRHMAPCTFNVALDLRTRVQLSPFSPGKLKISSRGFESVELESKKAPFTHPMGLISAIAAYFNADGVHIQIDSASPPRSALGGSSVAAVALVSAFWKATAPSGLFEPDPKAIALIAHAIEQSVAGVPCGLQDQLAAAYGGVNGWYWAARQGSLDFTRRVLVPGDMSHKFSQRILVAYCGAPHVSADVNGTWVRGFLDGRYRSEWERIVLYCRQFIDAVSQEDYGKAIEVINLETDLRLQMTPDVLDDVGRHLVDTARQHQCGARFTGAGGGGCVWALGEPDRIGPLRDAWQQVVSQHRNAMILDTAVDPNGVL